MKNLELVYIITSLDLTQSQAADKLGVSLRTMQRWCGGEQEIPASYANTLRLAWWVKEMHGPLFMFRPLLDELALAKPVVVPDDFTPPGRGRPEAVAGKRSW